MDLLHGRGPITWASTITWTWAIYMDADQLHGHGPFTWAYIITWVWTIYMGVDHLLDLQMVKTYRPLTFLF